MYNQTKVEKVLTQFNHLPRFPDGRINYTNARKAAVVNCFVMFNNKLLLLKRSSKVMVYRGKWNVVGGFLDEPVSVEGKVRQELKEELDIGNDIIKSIKCFSRIDYPDTLAGRTWIIFPSVAKLSSSPTIKLDWEHSEYRWILPSELADFDTVKGLDMLLSRVMPEIFSKSNQ